MTLGNHAQRCVQGTPSPRLREREGRVPRIYPFYFQAAGTHPCPGTNVALSLAKGTIRAVTVRVLSSSDNDTSPIPGSKSLWQSPIARPPM